ncbi:MAG: hypothetical protein NZ895_03250 [Archaeoglobaceae archaeon]|nr:hypothetical protein [Archaeoglobaceae archaeon]MCX8152104.1 hypothetical protein [Archaeoglobaceae archaeon]MDW8013539.1 hypothetical protein [Archaeoglobaceae archaeon]
MKVAWDASHWEFSINDYYYFSKLLKLAKEEGFDVEEIKSFRKLERYDVIVFNYPEKPFSRSEVAKIIKWFKNKKIIIFTAYYNNYDNVSENVNRVTLNLGIKVNYDLIKDQEKNLCDEIFPIAKWNNREVLMPCSASITGGDPFVVGKDVFAAKIDNLAVLGTCVFWDNYSIDVKENRKLAIAILSGEF